MSSKEILQPINSPSAECVQMSMQAIREPLVAIREPLVKGMYLRHCRQRQSQLLFGTLFPSPSPCHDCAPSLQALGPAQIAYVELQTVTKMGNSCAHIHQKFHKLLSIVS